MMKLVSRSELDLILFLFRLPSCPGSARVREGPRNKSRGSRREKKMGALPGCTQVQTAITAGPDKLLSPAPCVTDENPVPLGKRLYVCNAVAQEGVVLSHLART